MGTLLEKTSTLTTSNAVASDKQSLINSKFSGINNHFVRVYKDLTDVHDKFEDWLKSFVEKIDTDVMPGSQDFSSAYLPQQPLNSFLFPKLQECPSLNLVTNPHKFEMAHGLEFLGTSGQNIHDMQLFARLSDPSPLGCLKLLLEMRQLCPTAPDTLRAFPFKDFDPFMIDAKGPDVFFAGC